MYETHVHTPLCKHAVGEPEQYADVALRRGLRGLVVTCHNPMPDGFASGVRMAPDQLSQYVEMVQRAADAFAGRLDVRLGLEADYFPGYEAWLERQLSSWPFDYVIGSVHPQLAEFRQLADPSDPRAFYQTYFRLLGDSAETGLFECLAHPDIVKIVDPPSWHPEQLMDDIRRALDRVAATGVALEVNTSGVHKPYPEMNPFPAMLREMQVRQIPVVIGSDAHTPERVGELFHEALDLVEQAGYGRVCYFVKRQRHEVSVDEFRRLLQPAEPAVRPAGEHLGN